MVLGNQAAVDKVKKGQPNFMVDGSLIIGKDSAVTGTREDGLNAIPFSLADGALVDLSFKGETMHRCTDPAIGVHAGFLQCLP